MNKKLKVSIVILLTTLCLITATFAVIHFTVDLDNTATVSSDYTLEVHEGETTSGPVITAITWGDFASVGASVTNYVCVKNIGNMPLKTSWTTTNMSTIFTLNVEIWDWASTSYIPWNTGELAPASIAPNEYDKIKLTLTLITATAGNYEFTTSFHSNDV